MSLEDILKLLQAIGLSPLELLTVVALILVYQKNEQLYQEVMTLEASLDECLGKITPKSAEMGQKGHFLLR